MILKNELSIMDKNFSILLNANPEQISKLENLQKNFIDVCNAIAPVVQETRCWNRVVLHHMVYHKLRAQFPLMGSQMICNAVYSVCRAARVILQHPKSPFYLKDGEEVKLPRIVFLPNSPVYFDRHTLNIKDQSLSMFTLDGRIRFDIQLSKSQYKSFVRDKLKEVLLLKINQQFYLQFHFEMESKKVRNKISIPDNLKVIPSANAQFLQQAV